jgi:type I restriction enzyme S subunit
MENQKSKKPLIRFPEFKDAWEHKQLSEFLSESKKRNEKLKFGKDKVLSVSGESGIVNQIEHLGRSYAGVSVHQYHIVDTGDIVYTKSPLKDNPFGIIRLNKGKAGIVSTLYAVYKPNKKTAYAPFLDYYFSLDSNTNRYLRPLVKKGAKNDMKINNEYVLNDKIFVPSLKEQKRVASFFSNIDKKIYELKQKKNLLEEYKMGVLQKIFSRKLKFKDNKGKYFPKWTKRKIKDTGYFIGGGTPSTQNSNYWKGNIPWLSSSDLSEDDIYQINSTRFITEDAILNSAAKVIPKNSILIVSRVGVGKVAINKVPVCTSQDFTNLIVNKKNNHIFLAYLIKRKTNQLLAFNQGTSIKGFVKSDLEELEILLPTIKEQNIISDFLKSLDSKLYSTAIQIQLTVQYRKGLLQKMFC